MKKTLACLITYFNERELLTECLRSLAGQSRRPDEILVYDDASQHPAAGFIPAGLPVRVIRGDVNVGPARGRNRLWREAATEYVHFHDADDWFDPAWGEKVGFLLDSRAPDAVFTEVSSHRDGQLYRESILGLRELRGGGDLTQYCLHHPLLVPSGTYRKALIESIGGYRESLWQSEDYDFHVRLAARKPHYVLLLEPLVHIRLRPESRSQRHDEVWSCRLQALMLLGAELPPLYRRELAEAASFVGSELFRHGNREAARRAFLLAEQLGPPQFHHQQRFYRMIARRLGPTTAEWVGSVYRNVLPTGIREKIRKRG